jgi:mannosyltransferase
MVNQVSQGRTQKSVSTVSIPIAIAILTLAVRLAGIGRASLWLDEAISYLATALPATALLDNSIADPHPPLYYLFLSGWRLLSTDSDAALRLLSVLWNVALVPLVYVFGATLFDRRAGLVAALLVVVSPFHLLYSHELRMYTQLMFLVVLGVWAYWQSLQRTHRGWLVLYFAAFALAVYTHLFAWPVLGAIVVHALIYAPSRRLRWATLLLAGLIALLFLPWLLLVLGERQGALGSLRPLAQGGELNVIKPLTDLAFLAFGIGSQPLYVGAALFFTLALLLLLLVAARRAPAAHRPALALLWLLLAAALSPLAVYYVRPFFLPARTLAAASPFWLLLWAWGATQRRTPLPYLVALAAVTMAAGSLLYLAGEPVKPPYREAMALVAGAVEPGDAVLHTSDGSYLPALRYVTLPRHGLLLGDPDPRKPREVYEAFGGVLWSREEALAAGERLWLVVALEHSLDWQLEQVGWFDSRLERLREEEVGGIQIILYARP